MASRRWMMAGLAMVVMMSNPPRAHADEGDTTLAIMPVFSQVVAWRLPPGFHRANEETDARSYMFQATPEGETVDHWSQLIGLTGAAGRAADAKMTPKGFASGIAGGFKQDCPDSYHGIELHAPAIDGYDTFAAVVSCGTTANGLPAQSKTDLVVVVKGAHDYYTFQWAERGPARSGPMPIDADLWSRRLAGLMPIHLCDRIPGEKPPYPSCVSHITDLPDAGRGDTARKANAADQDVVLKQWEAVGFVITLQHYVSTLASACEPVLGIAGKEGGRLLKNWRNQTPNGLFLEISLAYQHAFVAAVEKSEGKQAAQGVLTRQMNLVRQQGDDEARKLLGGTASAKAETCRRFQTDVASGAYNIGEGMRYYDTLAALSDQMLEDDSSGPNP